jgi:hypothetical protein
MISHAYGDIDQSMRIAIMEQIYKDRNNRNLFYPLATQIVNQRIPQISKIHEDSHLNQLKEHGCIIINDFLNKEEIEHILDLTKKNPGYNAHVPVYSDGVARFYNENYEYNTLSYRPDLFLQDEIVLKKITHPYLISLAQGYLNCFPTMYSINCWWHKFSPSTYSTQKTHRDHDDFRFLAFFIYLTDIDENNGPHVFYPKTHDGTDRHEQVVITGKAGTAIMADTYALHRGQPLKQGERLLIWWRYGMYVNEIHYNDKNYLYKVPHENVFPLIEDNLHNRYLLRAFLKE